MDSIPTAADTAPQAGGSSAKQRTGVRGEYTAETKVLWLYGAGEEPTAAGHSEHAPPADPSTSVLCVALVPGYMTPTDFLSFTGAHHTHISHTLAVRHAHAPSGCLVALRFTSAAHAEDFRRAFDGRTFSPLEPEVCTVGRVHGARMPGRPAGHLGHPLEAFRVEGGENCAVCLEPLEGPLLTIMCRHTFHAGCLGRWGDGACPVCRGRQTAAFVDHEAVRGLDGLAEPPAGDSQCQECGRADDLWICLVCGTVGCGRYASGHAKDHFARTAHPYAMKIDSKAVWDYAGDGYVHRVLQSAGDGKLVALESSSDAPEKQADEAEQGALLEAKLASLRDHHAEEMLRQAHELHAQHDRRMAAARQAHERAIEALQREWAAERSALETAAARARRLAEDAQRRLEDRAASAQALAEDMRRRLEEEREISRLLVERQEEAAERERRALARVDELAEHVRDLTFFISTQERLAKEGDAAELQGASIVAPPPPPEPRQPSAHRKPRTSGKRRIPR
ncbi:hypothetical protein GGI15_003818 [Coemansia interrupta]|uniref:BRCA1-associated protein n=1 Tax=Coemansia interrupta TaxID=1126814 RepID=A0A9W8LHN8_9FUNG|nr:hypothetical protein GGI15_003818 [Coemansia interrupta]